MKKLRKEKLSDILPRLEAMQQNYATLTVEIPQLIEAAVKKTVNGKIDILREENEQWHLERKADMERILPVVEAYEASKEAVDTARRGGKVVIWLAATISAIGGAYLIVRMIFFKF